MHHIQLLIEGVTYVKDSVMEFDEYEFLFTWRITLFNDTDFAL